jgi:hypothetical protein
VTGKERAGEMVPQTSSLGDTEKYCKQVIIVKSGAQSSLHASNFEGSLGIIRFKHNFIYEEVLES